MLRLEGQYPVALDKLTEDAAANNRECGRVFRRSAFPSAPRMSSVVAGATRAAYGRGEGAVKGVIVRPRLQTGTSVNQRGSVRAVRREAALLCGTPAALVPTRYEDAALPP